MNDLVCGESVPDALGDGLDKLEPGFDAVLVVSLLLSCEVAVSGDVFFSGAG